MFDFGQYLDPVEKGFGNVMSDPRMAGALLSMAGQFAQPLQFGQNPVAGLFSGLGAGGESIRTQDAAKEKQQELESKQSLRESQANTAEARLGTASARNDTSSARLALQQQEADAKNTRNQMQNMLRIQGLHQREVKRVQDLNKNAIYDPKAVTQPVPTLQEFLKANPHLLVAAPMMGTPDTADSGSGAPAPSEGAPTATPGQSRSPGWYGTPKGRLYWNGSAWTDSP